MAKKTLKEKKEIPLNDALKMRVIKVKAELPKSGVTTLFFHYFKDFNDTVKNRSKVSNVLQTRITDEEITGKLEELSELLKKD